MSNTVLPDFTWREVPDKNVWRKYKTSPYKTVGSHSDSKSIKIEESTGFTGRHIRRKTDLVVTEKKGSKTTYTVKPGITRIPSGAWKKKTELCALNLQDVLILGDSAAAECIRLSKVDLGQVIQISDNVFQKCTGLKGITIPEDCCRMGEGVFLGCTQLRIVEFSDGCKVTELPKDLFSGCTKLRSVTLPSGLRKIDDRAFFKCKSLSELHLPEALKSIGKHAFAWTTLQEITLPEGLIEIDMDAFHCCKGITCIRIPKRVEYIGHKAFSGSARLRVIEFEGDPDLVEPHFANKDCIVRCHKGSYIEKQALEEGMKVEYISKEPQ